MATEKLKQLIDFDGTLTEEELQAAELIGIALEMLAKILDCQPAELETVYRQIKTQVLTSPHLYPWKINDLPACYAYEGAYLLNTVILQQIIQTDSRFLAAVTAKYPAGKIDSITQCVNLLFHEGSLNVKPHFLPGARDFLLALLERPELEPTIFTNSETRKIAKNLKLLAIGEKGTNHPYPHEIGILGDTRQYFMDSSWPQTFEHPLHGSIQILPIDNLFQVELRRPIYYAALKKIKGQGYRDIVVIADGFSLAGALPLTMGHHFILLKTAYSPDWAESYVASHSHGKVAPNLDAVLEAILEVNS